MSDPLTDYYKALERLKKKKAKINNDAVAIEAGRKKGSIKKSREIFHDLILAIEDARACQSQSRDAVRAGLIKAKQNIKSLRGQLDAAFARELSLLHELYAIKKRLAMLTGEKVIPIRGYKSRVRA